ncbi:hypothetical protein WJX73_007432 [Symbiochloris irregularis]|uniref:RING-type domain-containing protein n=1 Tax=Symbiochloris irregularis TaxID=706552 RepID=A0AAW1PRY1_9CHLO
MSGWVLFEALDSLAAWSKTTWSDPVIRSSLREVDRRFEKEAAAIIAEYDSLTARRRLPVSLLTTLGSSADGLQQGSKAWNKIKERVAWARRYARINALALRKIAKKHDKLMRTRTGHLFLQRCWKGEAVVRTFLGGPLHAELAAVQDLLHQSSASQQPDAAANTAQGSGDPGHLVEQLMSNTARDENDPCTAGVASTREDVTCPICMDLMYEPAALACGHKFCSRCAISAAGHADSASVVRFRDLLRVRTRDASCPMCRAQFVAQGEVGVFEAGAELPHVGQLIRQRFSQEWKERHDEELAEQAKRAPPPRRWFGGHSVERHAT